MAALAGMVAEMVRAMAAVVLDEADSVPMFVVELLNEPVASDNCAVNTLDDPKMPVVEKGTETVLPAQAEEGESVPTVIV